MHTYRLYEHFRTCFFSFLFFIFFFFSLLCLVFFPLNLIWSRTVWFGLFHSISHCTSLSPCIENKGFSPRNYLLIMHRNVVGIISECLPIEVFTQWKTFNTWKEWTLVIASKQPNSPHISISKWKNLHMLGLSHDYNQIVDGTFTIGQHLFQTWISHSI